MAWPIPKPLRVVCTKCPAVATVHHQEPSAVEDAVLLWVECHGEHTLALVDCHLILKLEACGGDLLMNALRPINAQERRNQAAARMLAAAEQVLFFDRFLARRP